MDINLTNRTILITGACGRLGKQVIRLLHRSRSVVGVDRRPFPDKPKDIVHAQVDILIDDEFIEAWEHGIVVECVDGKLRRFYPRIFTYSADYPEK